MLRKAGVRRRRLKIRKLIGLCSTYIAIAVILAGLLIPIFWIVSISFKDQADVFSMPPKLIFRPTLVNYRNVLFGAKGTESSPIPLDILFPRNLLNSAIIGILSTGLAVTLGLPTAYALARYRFRGKRDLAFYILSTRMAPPLGVLIPFYVVYSKVGLLDKHLGLILIYLVFNLSLVVWMMRGFIKDVPVELEEAALVDGCTRLRAAVTVTLPLAAPGIAAAAIFCLLLSWNEFLFAVILTANAAKTAPVAIYSFITFREVVWGSLAAAGTLTTLPILIFVLIVQKQLVRGLTMGSIKG